MEMVGMGVGVGQMDRQRTKQLSSASTYSHGQGATADIISRLPTQPACARGGYGAFAQGIDLLHKHQSREKTSELQNSRSRRSSSQRWSGRA